MLMPTNRPTARNESIDTTDLDLTFAVLSQPSAQGVFISFKETATHVRINSALKYRVRRDIDSALDDLHGTYARDQKGRPWLALTDEPESVGKDLATISNRRCSLELNSSRLSAILAAHWSENGERKRLYWSGVREEMGPWTMYLMEDRDAE